VRGMELGSWGARRTSGLCVVSQGCAVERRMPSMSPLAPTPVSFVVWDARTCVIWSIAKELLLSTS
jgi:hypothetical protein